MPAVELRGTADLRKAMKRFTPDLEKTLRAELKRGLAPIARKAKGFVNSDSPMSGWAPRPYSEAHFPFYHATVIKAGIGYAVGASRINLYGFSSMAQIYNKSAAGAIYETAGRNGPQPWAGKNGGASKKFSHSTNKDAGAQFIANLPQLTSSLRGRGRLIYKAWAQDQGKAEGIANSAIDKASKEFNARTRRVSLSQAA